MDLAKKQSIAQRAIESISQHFDETVESVHAELDKLVAFIAAEKDKFAAKKAALVSATTKG